MDKHKYKHAHSHTLIEQSITVQPFNLILYNTTSNNTLSYSLKTFLLSSFWFAMVASVALSEEGGGDTERALNMDTLPTLYGVLFIQTNLYSLPQVLVV